MKTHYTYFIRNKLTRRRYIGVRSCDGGPNLDQYWGSCATLTEDIQETGVQHFQKRILQIFATRKEAMQHEILLHHKYNVLQDTMYYNVVKQTATGFDNSGRKYKHKNPRTEDTKRK